jgi:hypothetical protein
MAAVDDFKILDDAIKAGQRSVTLPDGRTFTLDQARTERDRLEKELRTKKSVEQSESESLNQSISNAQKLVQNAQTTYDATKRAFDKNNASAAQVERARLDLQNRQEGLARLTSATTVTAPATAPVVAPTAAGDVRVLSREQRGESTTPVPTTPPPPPTGDGKDKPKNGIKKEQVDAKLVELNLPDTPENRKIARQALKAGTTAAPGAVDTSWEPLFKQNYPQYSWMFTDLDRTKYADVFTLFSKAIDPKTGKQIMEDVEFDRRWKGTSFYRELETGKKGRELSAAIGNFTWGSGNLAKFLTKATQFGYEGENLKQQAYKDLFSKVGDKYVNDLAVKEVRASSPYLALKKIGTQYLTTFNDQTVEDALTGGMTADDLLRKSRELAKAMYPHLKDSIDAGVTLEDLAANYKQIAAKTLELDPSQIDMGLKFNEALNYTKDGQPRMLSLSEWETELRTNDKYKYSFTKQANQDATDIGLAIARAFGKVG